MSLDRKVSLWLVKYFMCIDSLICLQLQVSLGSSRFFVIFQSKEMFAARAKSKGGVSSHFSHYRNTSSLRKVLCIMHS